MIYLTPSRPPYLTPRLRLRHFTPADGPLLLALNSDPVVMRWINGGRPTTMAVIEETALPGMINSGEQRPGVGAFVAISRKTEEPVGWITLRPSADDPAALVLGYRLLRDYWGRGLAAEGASALLDLALGSGKWERITATTYEENIASQRVMAKLGMTLKRRFRYTPAELQRLEPHDDGEIDLWPGEDVEYEITQKTWLNQEKHAKLPISEKKLAKSVDKN